MSRWKSVFHEGTEFRNIGVYRDGTLYNPHGYPEDEVRAAVAAAEERRRRRRQEAAAKATDTRRHRREKRVYDVAQQITDGGSYGPAEACVICRRGLDDPQSIHRGIGSDCWQDVLKLIESRRTA